MRLSNTILIHWQCGSSGVPCYIDSPSQSCRFDEAVSLARKHAAPSRECSTGLHWPWWVQAQAAFLRGDLAQVCFPVSAIHLVRAVLLTTVYHYPYDIML